MASSYGTCTVQHKTYWTAQKCPTHRDRTMRAIPALAGIKSLSADDRAAIASLDGVTPATIQALTKDGSKKVREELAKRDDLDEQTLIFLANDKHEDVRAEIAMRDDCPTDVLESFCDDPDDRARHIALRNPLMPTASLEYAAYGDNAGDRDAAAWNPSTPPRALIHIAEIFASGSYARYSYTAGQGLDVALRHNRALPGEAVQRLARSESDDMAAAMAARPVLPAGMLRDLARDRKISVRAGAARNPELPIDLIQDLAAEGRSEIRTALLSNPAVPPHMLADLYRDCLTHAYTGVPSLMDVEAITSNPRFDGELLNDLHVLLEKHEGRGDYLTEQVRAAIDARICRDCDVEPDNIDLIEHLRGGTWWTYTADSTPVKIAKVVHR